MHDLDWASVLSPDEQRPNPAKVNPHQETAVPVAMPRVNGCWDPDGEVEDIVFFASPGWLHRVTPTRT
jgi:hypothetical protein